MHDSQEHVFTNEFDELCIVISLDMGINSGSMRITISEPDSVRVERVLPISMKNFHHVGTRQTHRTSAE